MAANDLAQADTPETRDAARRVLLATAYLAYVYVASYFLIMDPTGSTFDKHADTWTYYTACRFGPSTRIPGDFTLYGPTLCWANTVFSPIDWLRHCVWPSTDPEGLLYHEAQAPAEVVACFAFLVFVFAPVWVPMMIFAVSGRWNRCRSLLALPAAGLYMDFVFRFTANLFGYGTNGVLVSIIFAISAVAAIVGLAFSARGWRHLINVPLWLTLLALLATIAWNVYERL